MRSLHQAQIATEIGRANCREAELILTRLQDTRDDSWVALHVRPTLIHLDGTNLEAVLLLAGFRFGECAFTRQNCFSRPALPTLDLKDCADRLQKSFQLYRNAEAKLNSCWLPAPGHESAFRDAVRYGLRGGGFTEDGHRGEKVEYMKASTDDVFNFRFSWQAGPTKGWTIHVAPKHPPVDPALRSALEAVGLRTYGECAQNDFAPCWWRFIRYSPDGFFNGNATEAHAAFDAHATAFSSGLRSLLEAHGILDVVGMPLLKTRQEAPQPRSKINYGDIAPKGALISSELEAPRTTMPERFDVAISFAGQDRETAKRLATLTREAGFRVFFDEFFPEDLWGADLGKFFDEVFRLRARYCVILVSRQYADREWTEHERRSAVARAIKEKGADYILPVRIDDSELAGVAPTLGYVDVRKTPIDEIARILIAKLRGTERRTDSGA
jgi:hypothetical protein